MDDRCCATSGARRLGVEDARHPSPHAGLAAAHLPDVAHEADPSNYQDAAHEADPNHHRDAAHEADPSNYRYATDPLPGGTNAHPKALNGPAAHRTDPSDAQKRQSASPRGRHRICGQCRTGYSSQNCPESLRGVHLPSHSGSRTRRSCGRRSHRQRLTVGWDGQRLPSFDRCRSPCHRERYDPRGRNWGDGRSA